MADGGDLFRSRRRRHHDPLGAQTDHSHQSRTEDDREFSQHIEKTVILSRLLRGNEPRIIGSAESLNASLNTADEEGKNVELPLPGHHHSPNRYEHIDSDGQVNALADSPPLAELAEQDGSRKPYELHHEQGHDQIVRFEPDGHTVVHRHAYNRVHPVDVKPVGKKK